MKTTTALQALREQYEAKEKAKKTLNDLELFNYIDDKYKTVNNLTKSGCVKLIRKDDYAISQGRVFKIFEEIQSAINQDERDALVRVMSASDKKKLDAITKAREAAEAKLAEALAAIEAAQSNEAAALKSKK